MRRRLPTLIVFACAALLAFGLEQLFALRFATGDVYPPYSSLRADPLGTMAFYESLERLPGLSVQRDFSASNRLPSEPGTVYLHLAGEPGEWTEVPADLHHELKAYLAGGGRLVITFFPQNRTNFVSSDETDTNYFTPVPSSASGTNNSHLKPAKRDRQELLEPEEPMVDLAAEWGLHTRFEALPAGDQSYQAVTVYRRSGLALPATLDWHSGLVFTNCAAAWHTIYARGAEPVVLERQFGRGSVVVASDSYFVSNEALRNDPHADFLAWLIGTQTHVVFDEAHFGIYSSPGIATLMRQYHLHGLAAGLLLLAGLFIWKNSTSLAPPPPAAQRDDFVAGKDTASGFVNLLRRNLPAGEILGVCFAEWKKSSAPAGNISRARRQAAEAIFTDENNRPAAQRDPLGTYRQIAKTLGPRQQNL